MSDYPMLISNKLHSFRNFGTPFYIILFIGGANPSTCLLIPPTRWHCQNHLSNSASFSSTFDTPTPLATILPSGPMSNVAGMAVMP